MFLSFVHILDFGLWYAFYLFHTALLPLSYDDLTTFSFDFFFFKLHVTATVSYATQSLGFRLLCF